MGFITSNRPRKRLKVSLEAESVVLNEAQRKNDDDPGNQPLGHRNLTFEKLPLEIIQYIFVLSGEFALPLCSRRLYNGLTNSMVLRNHILTEHSLVLRGENWMVSALHVDMLSRKFVNSKILEQNKIRAFYSDDCDFEIEGKDPEATGNNDEGADTSIATSREHTPAFESVVSTPMSEYSTPQPESSVKTIEDLYRSYQNNVSNRPYLPDYLEPAVNFDINDRQFDVTLYLLSCNCVSKYPKSTVQEAAKRNNLLAVQKLVDCGLELDHNALINAFENENAEMVDYLLSLNSIDLNDSDLWAYVTSTQNINLFNFLRKVGGNPPYHTLPKI